MGENDYVVSIGDFGAKTEKVIPSGKRIRKWFITINQEAKCFKHVNSILKDLTSREDFYGLMLHDKDGSEEDHSVVCKPHYHLAIEFKNGKTFQRLQKLFFGAHIEQPDSWVGCVQYLIHLNETEEWKHHYKVEEVKTNNAPLLNSLMERGTIETFNPDKIDQYIQEGCTNITLFYVRFKSQIRGYIQLIDRLTQAHKEEVHRNPALRYKNYNEERALQKTFNKEDIDK